MLHVLTTNYSVWVHLGRNWVMVMFQWAEKVFNFWTHRQKLWNREMANTIALLAAFTRDSTAPWCHGLSAGPNIHVNPFLCNRFCATRLEQFSAKLLWALSLLRLAVNLGHCRWIQANHEYLQTDWGPWETRLYCIHKPLRCELLWKLGR